MNRDKALQLAKGRWPEVNERTIYVNTSLMVFEVARGRVELEPEKGVEGVLAWGYNPEIDMLAMITVDD